MTTEKEDISSKAENNAEDKAPKPEEKTAERDPAVEGSTSDADLMGQVVAGEVTNVTHFGAFVKLENGEEGLVHISEVVNEYVADITQFVAKGDTVNVKVLKRNNKNKLELSIKQSKDKEAKPALFIHKKTSDEVFEDKLNKFLKRSEEKQIDIRRTLKKKQGIKKRH